LRYIKATVPMRIDLAGGTLDVYPLYLFEGGGLTVNAAIDIMAEVRLDTRDDGQYIIHSRDQGHVEEVASLDEMSLDGPVSLVKHALRYYRPETGLDISLHSAAPTGSGIGASSALLMALSNCLNKLTGRGLSYERIIDVGANIEAQVIGIPTGKQDYFPPTYGGVCSIWFDVDGWRFESLSEDNDLVERLNERVIVSYTGIPHFSSITNWAMLRRYIENEGDTVARMREIKAVAKAMRGCLIDDDMDELVRLVDAEWQLRKGLADGVTTPKIDAIMAAAARAGARASKICGAGGGGCMITLADPDAREDVCRALREAGADVLDARVVNDGLVMEWPA
jgi:D-glycero-alpha-D-manno-heptose-7-phosphate kinase